MDTVDMEEIKNKMKEYDEEEKKAKVEVMKIEKDDENLPQGEIHGINEDFMRNRLAQMSVRFDEKQSASEQIAEAAEIAATFEAVKDEEVQKKMATAKGEQLVENVKAKAADSRADRVKAETEEQKAKREQNEAMLGIFNADKHYPEWFRKIVIIMFTPFYLILLFAIGVPTGILRFTLDCIDGILVRYESVDEKRRPKVRVTFWVLLLSALIIAIVLPVLKYFSLI